jgi:hypothetical protein
MKLSLILPPPPETEPEFPACAPLETEDDMWLAIEVMAEQETVRP